MVKSTYDILFICMYLKEGTVKYFKYLIIVFDSCV